MKILFITPFHLFPPYWGGGQRTYNLIKHLAKHHKVYLVSPFYRQFENKKNNEHRFELKKLGVEVFTPHPLIKIEHPFTKHVNPEVILKGLEIILTKKIDLIICDYPWSGINSIIIHLLTRKPFILHEHNVEYVIKDEIRARYGGLMKLLEYILCRYSKKIVTVSQIDKDILERELKINGGKIDVVGNGFDRENFFPNKKGGKKIREKYNVGKSPLIVFFGKLDYPPNKEAVYNIRWKILPNVLKKVSNAKFLIVGKEYKFDINHEAMAFTGLVDNIEDYVNAADVVIVPLLAGSGTRIKILESIACGKIVISTSKGAEGLINKLTKPFLKVTDDWETFSDNVVKTIKHPKGKRVSKKFVREYYWQNIYEEFNEILKGIK